MYDCILALVLTMYHITAEVEIELWAPPPQAVFPSLCYVSGPQSSRPRSASSRCPELRNAILILTDIRYSPR